MKADFTRGFNPDRKRGETYRRVLLQKGRALLDSDMAALVDATDSAIRDAVRLTACRAGSPDLGFLITPGVLLAHFDGALGTAFTLAGGALAVRDYSRRYLDRLPGLRIGGGGGTVTVPLVAPLDAPTAVRVWARADNGGATASVNGAALAIPGVPDYQPIDVTISGAELVFEVDPAVRYWIAMVETRAETTADRRPVLNVAGGNYEIDGLTTRTGGGLWPLLPVSSTTASEQFLDDARFSVDRRVLAYLELWERHVTHVEDPGIIEEALGGNVDTTTRTEVRAQIKIVPSPAGEEDTFADALAAPLLPAGRVSLGVANALISPDPCDLPVPGGYAGPDNRLYRLEVHATGESGALFKWSRENGAELFPASFPSSQGPASDASSVVVSAQTDLRDGDLVELLSESTDLGDDDRARLNASGFVRPQRAVGRLVRLSGGDVIMGTTRAFDLLDPDTETAVTGLDPTTFLDAAVLPETGPVGAAGLKLRRWSGLIRAGVDGVFELENGIQATISNTPEFEPGDWWQYEARTGADNANGPSDTTPHGPERLFAPLAVLSRDNPGTPMVVERWLDRRFPRLCEIQADDVSYDGARVGTLADTVQEALDELYQRESGAGCGEIPVPPDTDIRDIIDAIPPGGDAKICLGPGTRTIPSEVIVANKGHIMLTGIGGGTILEGSRELFVFENCASVTLVDFAMRTDQDAQPGRDCAILNIRDCGQVKVQNLVITSTAPSVRHGASAIKIRSTAVNSVRRAVVEDCRMSLGQGDTGVLIVQAGDAVVRNNVIEVPETPFDILSALQQDAFASLVGRVLINHLRVEIDTNIFVGGSAVDISIQEFGRHAVAIADWGQVPVEFTTHNTLSARLWERVAAANPPAAQSPNGAVLRAQIRRSRRGLARFALGAPGGELVSVPFDDRPAIQAVGAAIAGSATRSYGQSGIVIAATRGIDLGFTEVPNTLAHVPTRPSADVSGNIVVNFARGIQVGSSNAGTGSLQGNVSLFSDVQVDGNRIDLITPMYERNRWGIFVGNTMSGSVRNNRIGMRSPLAGQITASSPVDGVRVWGKFGPHVQVERNAVYNTTDGVRLQPVRPTDEGQGTTAWKVGDRTLEGFIPANSYYGLGTAEIGPGQFDSPS